MMNKHAISLLCLIFLFVGGAWAQDKAKNAAPETSSTTQTTTHTLTSYTPLTPPELAQLLGRISATLGAARSFRSNFTQERHLALFLDTLTAKGACYFAAPDKFRWEVSEPYISVMVFNHDQVAKFAYEQGKLKYIHSGAYAVMRQLLGQITGWMRGNFRSNQDVFSISGMRGGDYRIIMTPRKKELTEYIKTIEMTIHKDTLQVTTLTIREPREDFIEIKFSRTRENAALDQGLFDLKKPAPPQKMPEQKK